MPEHHRIAPTAFVTSYAWHALDMPHAGLFATARGRRLYWTYAALFEGVPRLVTRSPGLLEMLEYRHRVIEAGVAGHEPDLLVEIAGGLSRRAVTWAADHGVRAVEIDLPSMREAKQAFLDRAPAELRTRLAGRHSLLSADVLAEDFPRRLREVVAEARRPVVVAEGLLGYFRLEERVRLMTAVHGALADRDGIFLADAYTRESRDASRLTSRALALAISMVTRGQGARDSWETWADVEATYAQAGFTELEPLRAADLPAAARPRLSDQRSSVQIVRARRGRAAS